MEFFGREDEIQELRRIREISRQNARFTVITGRRRVGKTELARTLARALVRYQQTAVAYFESK